MGKFGLLTLNRLRMPALMHWRADGLMTGEPAGMGNNINSDD